MSKALDYLDQLESEAIYILREVAGQFERPALLFSGGKDSITLVRLAEKAFRPELAAGLGARQCTVTDLALALRDVRFLG